MIREIMKAGERVLEEELQLQFEINNCGALGSEGQPSSASAVRTHNQKILGKKVTDVGDPQKRNGETTIKLLVNRL